MTDERRFPIKRTVVTKWSSLPYPHGSEKTTELIEAGSIPWSMALVAYRNMGGRVGSDPLTMIEARGGWTWLELIDLLGGRKEDGSRYVD